MLVEKSDGRGLIHLAAHFGLIAVLAGLVLSDVPYWPLLMAPLGIAEIFLFTALHEATHLTAFRTEWINRVVAAICGFVILVPAEWFRYFHFAHHRYTHDRDRDPELEGGKPETTNAYLLYLSGLTVWKGDVSTLLSNALGRIGYAYVPEKSRHRLETEARLSLAAYAALAAGSVFLHSAALLWSWIIPLLIGQPFLRAYLLAEHTRCPHVANMLENTRTTFTWPLVRFIAWNMPYHAEHHAHPNVPFWKLPVFHRIVREHLKTTERGYVRFHRGLIGSLTGSAKTP